MDFQGHKPENTESMDRKEPEDASGVSSKESASAPAKSIGKRMSRIKGLLEGALTDLSREPGKAKTNPPVQEHKKSEPEVKSVEPKTGSIEAEERQDKREPSPIEQKAETHEEVAQTLPVVETHIIEETAVPAVEKIPADRKHAEPEAAEPEAAAARARPE